MAKSLDGLIKEKVGIINDINYISYITEQRAINSAIRHKRMVDFSKAAETFYKNGGKLEDILKNPSLISDLNSNLKFETKDDFEDFIKSFNRFAYTDFGYEYGKLGIPIEEIPAEFINNQSLNNIELQKVNYFKEGYDSGLLEYYYNLGLSGIRYDKIEVNFFNTKMKSDSCLKKNHDGYNQYLNQDNIKENKKR